MVTKIFITGCAKSGTTLLRRLMYAFKDISMIQGEVFITRVIEESPATRVLVAKRQRCSLFSDRLGPAATAEWARLVQHHDIKILNVIRDGQDTILSDNKNVAPGRWIVCMQQRRSHADLITYEVRYEDIVQDPDNTQRQIAEVFDLEIEHLWSDYPDFVPDEEFLRWPEGIYSKRPLDESSIGKGLPYKGLLAEDFEHELQLAGYNG